MIVMLVPSVITLAIAIIAVYVGSKVKNEIVQPVVALTALVGLFSSFIFTPWPIVLLMIMAILAINKLIKPLMQADLWAEECREITCPFPVAFALTHRCAAYPTTSPLWRLGERKMQRLCVQNGCCGSRKKQ